MSLIDLLNVGRRPVAPLAGFPAVHLTGTNIKANLTDPAVQAKSLLEFYRRAKPDVLFIMMDLTVESEALGAAIRMPENDNPAVASHFIKTVADAEKLKTPASPAGRMNVFINTIGLLKKGGAQAVAAYAIGPFTLASELIGAEDAALMTITDPATVHALIEKSVETVGMYTKALEKAGADVIVILEPDAMYLSPSKFREFAAQHVKRIIGGLKAPAVLHICGDTSHLIKDMAATGASGLSLDADVDLTWAIKQVPNDVTVIGNISPNFLLESDRAGVSSACAKLLQDMKPYPNFILSSGCDLPVDTPLENIVAMVESVQKY